MTPEKTYYTPHPLTQEQRIENARRGHKDAIDSRRQKAVQFKQMRDAGMTLKQIGAAHNLSSERVRQILRIHAGDC